MKTNNFTRVKNIIIGCILAISVGFFCIGCGSKKSATPIGTPPPSGVVTLEIDKPKNGIINTTIGQVFIYLPKSGGTLMIKCEDTTSCRYIYPMEGKLTSENFKDLNGSLLSQSIASKISDYNENWWAKIPEDSNRKIEETWYRLGFSNGSITPKIWTATFTPNKFDIVTLLSQNEAGETNPKKITGNVNRYVMGQVFLPISETGGTLEVKTDDGHYASVEIYYIAPGTELDDSKVNSVINNPTFCKSTINGRLSFSIASQDLGKWYYVKFLNETPITVITTFVKEPDVIASGFYYIEGSCGDDGSLPLDNIKYILLSILGTNGVLTNGTTLPSPNKNKKIFPIMYPSNDNQSIASYRNDDETLAYYANQDGNDTGYTYVFWNKFEKLHALHSYKTDKYVLLGCAIAHEMGHALREDHSSDEDSIMQDTLTKIDAAIDRHRNPKDQLVKKEPNWLPKYP